MEDSSIRGFDPTMDRFPTIVCLCGSTRFYGQFRRSDYEETMKGNIVLSVGFSYSTNDHRESVGCTPEQKLMLDELHKRKIDLANEILVLNVGGYVGESTASEIMYAISTGKTVRWLEEDHKLNYEQIFSYENLKRTDNKKIWEFVSTYMRLPEEFIEEFQDRVHWRRISRYQKLCEPFMEKFINKLDGCLISKYQKLSEKFIERHEHDLWWSEISLYQKLSIDFIAKFHLKIDRQHLMDNVNIDKETKDKAQRIVFYGDRYIEKE